MPSDTVHMYVIIQVEDLLEGFTTDLGITADQFTQACSQLQTSKAGQENEVHKIQTHNITKL